VTPDAATSASRAAEALFGVPGLRPPRCSPGFDPAAICIGNRGGRLVADLVGVDDRHPRHQDHHGLAVLALLGPGDELVAPAHDLADVRKADQLELADDLLDRHLGALSPGAHDLRDAGLNPNIS